MELRGACLAAAFTGLLLGTAGAQEQQAPAAAQDPARVRAAVDKWLASEHTSADLLDATTAAVLADQEHGFAYVGELLGATQGEPRTPRAKAVRQLASRVSLAFLQRESEGKLVYAGQYGPLRPLQPFVGNLFFSWLLDTPSWYPDTHRIRLVPALRDLQPGAPGRRRLEGVLAMVANEAVEPEDLRTALACMLWQWGDKEHIRPRLDKLVRDSAEGELEDRVQALLRLADLYYELRDYKASARTHRALQALAGGADYPLKPYDWYSAACVHALSGDVEAGIEAFAKCAELQASPDVDRSHKVEREVLERDPEIAALRGHARFAGLLAQALGGLDPGGADPWKKKQ